MMTDQKIILATNIHQKLCRWNHTDGCAWEYERWDNLPRYSTRKEYLAKAEKIIEAVGFEPAMSVINLLK